MGDEYEHALNDATQEEIIDLAGNILIYIVVVFSVFLSFKPDYYNQLSNFFSYFGLPLHDESRSVPRLTPEQGSAHRSWMGWYHKGNTAKGLSCRATKLDRH